ncbi:MAG: lysophospholipid acyltransferase family protein [Pseudomonadota bacterium]
MGSSFNIRSFLSPRHWPVWLVIGLHRLLTLLPWRLQRLLGSAIGRLAARVATRRKRIAEENITIAFPDESDTTRATLVREHFKNLGIGLFEIGMAWWASDRRIARLCDVSGLQHLAPADSPEATFLVAGHFTSIDMVARGLGLYADFDVIHRPLGIPLLDAFTQRGRLRSAKHLIDKRSPKALLTAVRQQRSIWIAVDQADTTSGSVDAPFFGRLAPTNTTVPRIAQKSGVRVVPISCIRDKRGRYQITLDPPLSDFGNDIAGDAATLNTCVEQTVMRAPAQYYWIHRRYKTVERT